ncbi:hypothetical protein LCGC14_1358580 [marine sediment metagenome]|uniref:endopeptidase La n=1 Tax=marine sediment metagenome TaxID=412755 RepID=A0A0F9NB31_9ZZZZ
MQSGQEGEPTQVVPQEGKPQVRIPEVIPLIGSGSTVMFPQQLMPVLATEEKEIKAIDDAAAEVKVLGLFSQTPGPGQGDYEGDLHDVGTAATIVRMAKAPDGSVHAILQGVARIRLTKMEQSKPWMRGRVERLEDEIKVDLEVEAMVRNAVATFERVVEMSEALPKELVSAVKNVSEPSALTDFIAANINITPEQRQGVLEELDVHQRLQQVLDFLSHEQDVLKVESKIQSQVRGELDKKQREFILREQMKAIQKELGEGDVTPELSELKKRLDEADLPEEARKEADREMQRLMTIPSISPEYQVARTYLEWLADLPWNVSTEDSLDIDRAEETLDADHYGLDKVKQRILDFLAVRKLRAGETRGPILCFVGPPGTGKTSLGQSIARALGRKFIRMSLGGIRDEADIRGHRRTYVGAMPGRIIQELRRCGSNNPLFMLDEVDKMGVDFRGDPASALLEVLDPAQNHTFTDHYGPCSFIYDHSGYSVRNKGKILQAGDETNEKTFFLIFLRNFYFHCAGVHSFSQTLREIFIYYLTHPTGGSEIRPGKNQG